MILKNDIEKVVNSQKEIISKRKLEITKREFEIGELQTHIEIISGIRRCGKSTLMLQLIQQKYKEAPYINFEEPALFNFELSDFDKLMEVFGDNKEVYFFDEIQNINGWEVFIRSLHDSGKKIFITGSNASMLSRELGTKLTGRYIQRELFPFSYPEYLKHFKLGNDRESFISYLNIGGFPEYLKQNKIEILHQLYRDIINRDIVVRHKLKNGHELEELCLYLFSNISKEFTYNSLRKLLNIASTTTVSNYINWLQDSYLIFLVPRFSYSAKSILVQPKKIYAIDNGLVNSISISKTNDMGRLLENLVFLHLLRTGLNISYFREKTECDFVVFDKKEFHAAFQVCFDITNENMNREVNGLVEALNFFKKDKGFIITLNQTDELRTEGKIIKIIPAREFLQMKIEDSNDF